MQHKVSALILIVALSYQSARIRCTTLNTWKFTEESSYMYIFCVPSMSQNGAMYASMYECVLFSVFQDRLMLSGKEETHRLLKEALPKLEDLKAESSILYYPLQPVDTKHSPLKPSPLPTVHYDSVDFECHQVLTVLK